MNVKLFHSTEQITPEWLTQRLREKGALHQGRVVSITPSSSNSDVDEGPGFRNSNRLEIQYSPNATPSAPRRLYLKAQDGALHKSAGEREVAFYVSATAQMTRPPVPTCFDAAYDSETGAYHLLLEDVSETHRTVHPEEPATQTDIKLMLEALAQLHAYWWEHHQLGQSIGTLPTADETHASFTQLEAAFPNYIDFLGDRLSNERRRIYETVLARYPDVLCQRLTHPEALTLVHNDAHAGNFLLPRGMTEQRVYLIDWQQWGIHSGLHDAAYLIALFWYPERRARMEQWAIKSYHDQLCRSGVAGFDWQACWNDYRLQAIENLLVPFWAWIFHGENWGFHRWHQLEKALLAFQDLQCEEFLK